MIPRFSSALWLTALLSIAWTPRAPTKAMGCSAEGRLPDRACTPGAVATTDPAIVCGTSTRERRHVTEAVRRQVFRSYGLSPRQDAGAYEVDHLIPLELGGSNAIANLWPEPAPGYHQKDRVENILHDRVCAGRMTIDDAQRAMAQDWTSAVGPIAP